MDDARMQSVLKAVDSLAMGKRPGQGADDELVAIAGVISESRLRPTDELKARLQTLKEQYAPAAGRGVAAPTLGQRLAALIGRAGLPRLAFACAIIIVAGFVTLSFAKSGIDESIEPRSHSVAIDQSYSSDSGVSRSATVAKPAHKERAKRKGKGTALATVEGTVVASSEPAQLGAGSGKKKIQGSGTVKTNSKGPKPKVPVVTATPNPACRLSLDSETTTTPEEEKPPVQPQQDSAGAAPSNTSGASQTKTRSGKC